MYLRLLIVVGVVLLAGCTGLTVLEEGETPTEAITNTDMATDTTTAKATLTETERNLTEREQEILLSGEQFSELVSDAMSRHDYTDMVSYQASPNNTIVMEIQVNGGAPLERHVMDGAQAVAGITWLASDEGEPARRQNGSLKRYYQPDLVTVHLQDRYGDRLATYSVDPTDAREYRERDIHPNEFAARVMESVEVRDTYHRGELPTSQYLNRSELSVWVQDYALKTNEWWLEHGDEDDAQFPVDGIKYNSSNGEVLHVVLWDRSVYDQYFGSAEATMVTGYWITAAESHAMPPRRLNIYIELPENDRENNFAAYMERENVYRFLSTDRGHTARRWYLDQVEAWFPDHSEGNPFESRF